MLRAPKDGRARANLLKLIGPLLLFAAFLFVYFFMFYGSWHDLGARGTISSVAFWVALSLIIGLVVKFRQNAQQRAFDRDSPAVSAEMKCALFREACVLATLLERLGSESYLEKEIPPEIMIVTRRVLLDRLAALGLRDSLEPELRNLLLAPDGHWTTEQKKRATPSWECLSVLCWILGVKELRSLTDNPGYSLAEARSLFEIKEPDKLRVLASWDVRPARDGANRFLQRCWAELVARGAIGNAPEQDVEHALALRTKIQDAGYTSDYLVGARTISELETPLLFLMAQRAYNRWQFLGLLADVLSGEKGAREIRSFLSQYFAPAKPAEAAAESV